VRSSEGEDQTVGRIALQAQQFKERRQIGWDDQL
jgi:hypothetical protein